MSAIAKPAMPIMATPISAPMRARESCIVFIVDIPSLLVSRDSGMHGGRANAPPGRQASGRTDQGAGRSWRRMFAKAVNLRIAAGGKHPHRHGPDFNHSG